MKKIYYLLMMFVGVVIVTNKANAQYSEEPKTGYYSSDTWQNDRTTVNSSWYSSTNCVNVGTVNKPIMQCADGGGDEVLSVDEKFVYCEFQTDETKFLSVTNFNFKFNDLPASIKPEEVEITAIEITFSRNVSGGSIVDKEVRLIKNGTVSYGGFSVGESNKAKPNAKAYEWPKSAAFVSYGGPTDPYPLWGTTWTLADIMDTGFGVAISAKKTNGNNSIRAYIGYVGLKVYYTTNITPLPVSLTYFTANYQNNQVVLDWNTATEKDNDFFTIERSANGDDFSEISLIKGAGTSQESSSYKFIDANYIPGVSYYRLKQTDYDGTTTYSKVVTVSSERKYIDVVLFPNPSDGHNININVANEVQAKAIVTIYNSAGEQMFRNELDNVGNLPVSLHTPNKLNAGLYLIHVESGDRNMKKSFVVQ